MDQPIAVPLWLFLPIAAFALWSLLDRLLIPSVRWVLRRRVNRLIDRVNQRLQVEIRPFQLTKRQVLVDRLIYDPQVVAAANEHAQTAKLPREVVMTNVRRYANEVVPAFNAYFYFRIGYWMARALARALYRVRVGVTDDSALAAVEQNATVIFVMNHRSNMDYVLVAFLAAERTALSYAVGEWARVWPLQTLIKAMGAYFVRRSSNDPLYRRVLERYVHMATEAGVAQAMYPEGGLTRDGMLREPRLGLFDYALKSFDPKGTRDIVFVPVGINYDRVLEDRTQLRAGDPAAERRSGGYAMRTTLRFVGRNLRQMLGGNWYRFGYACVNFGRPISARAWLAQHAERFGGDLRSLSKEKRFEAIGVLANELMSAIGMVVPVLPVSLVATVLLDAERPLDELELKARCLALAEALREGGARIYVPRDDRDYAIHVGLRMLRLRRLVTQTEDGLNAANPDETPVLRYYANAIAHLPRHEPRPGGERSARSAE